ncbi:putative alpha-glucuronidase A [Fusarium kuroshium]|nr:putative alpha-glucuronidase A [Fusarium kuroshium]
MDRTVHNGTGNAGQYPTGIANLYEHTDTTPDDLMLWFHHVPYSFKLHSGKSVIQHFYDAHYDGAKVAQTFPALWDSLRGKIDDKIFHHELFRLKYQAGHSIVWRDAVTEFYRNLSGIPDELGRVRHHPYRIEAEKMVLEGYHPVNVTPTETASKYVGVQTNGTGTATAVLQFPKGKYNLAINYYDLAKGQATWTVYLNKQLVGQWRGDNEDKLGHWPSDFLDGHSASRITFEGVQITPGDELVIVGKADGEEYAPLDYVSVLPEGIVD